MNLSKTEYRVAGFIAQGLIEKEIAQEMFISQNTVHNHAYNIRKKWGARNAVDIARKFILSLDDPKQYFAAVFCLLIQLHVMTFMPDPDLRRPTKTTVKSKNSNFRINEYAI